MTDKGEFPRRSPRFANQDNEIQQAKQMDGANSPVEASRISATLSTEVYTNTSPTGMPEYAPFQANTISTKAITTNRENMNVIYTIAAPVSTPVPQDMLKEMQMKIEELEKKLKSSLESKGQHNFIDSHQTSSTKTASTSQHVSTCRQRPFAGEFEFYSFANGNAAANERQPYELNTCGNFNLNAANECSSYQRVSGNSQQSSLQSGNCLPNPMAFNHETQSNAPNAGNFYPNQYLPRKLQELPQFSGEPDIWPMFSVSYHQSSSEYRYTNFENCQRLQRSLKGAAFDSVKSLLIHPDNVGVVMEQLEFRFGRPEQLIASQLKVIRDVAPISESAIGKIISFATIVRNLSVFLQSAGAQQHLANPTLIDELVSKLPMSRKIEWAKYAAPIKPYPTVINFSDWINETANVLCLISDGRFDQPDLKRKTVLHMNTASEARPEKCYLCGKEHKLYRCELFLNKSVDERWSEVKRLKLCFSCLCKGHSSRECRAKRECSYFDCKKTHNKLLHESQKRNLKTEQPPTNNHTVLNCMARNKLTKVLFKILPITLYGSRAKVTTYAIIDDASAVTLMSQSLRLKLGLNGKSSQIELGWLRDGSIREKTTLVNVMISGSKDCKKHWLKDVHAVNELSLPVQSLELCDMEEMNPSVDTIDIDEYSNAIPEVLIGLNNAHLGAAIETVELFEKGPYATNTKLGWIVYGSMKNGNDSIAATCLHVRNVEEQSLEEIVNEYFSTESFGVRPAPVVESDDDIRARKILNTRTKIVNGRFHAGLLWKDDSSKLPDSFSMALKRLGNIERKMNRNAEFASRYKNAIENYIKKGYAKKLSSDKLNEIKPRIWYLPHFAVFNPNKPQKLRLVFDAAATVGNVSLNSFLLKGPQEYQPLPSVLFNFRIGCIAVCADISEMFHQVYIRAEDRCAQRFLWRNGCQDRPPDVYEMQVMTFGAACSPCIAQYVKVENAKSHTQHDPRAIRAILENHYVDDYVDSFQSIEEAIYISSQVQQIHRDAGFELCGFISNSQDVVNALNGAQRDTDLIFDGTLSTERVLGMYWYPENDSFRFRLKFHKVDENVVNGKRVPTKRELLSIIMSVFDPLGLLGHLTVTAKLIMREVWKCNVRWDDSLPNHINIAWLKWKRDLDNVTKIEIPRSYFNNKTYDKLDLHIFVDASESAFAAVAYWRFICVDGKTDVSFICSKSRCAPMKQLSVPRMELQAAVLGVRLMQTIVKEHQLKINDYVLWSDSSTVLKWIQSPNRRYKQFVAHRVNEILNATNMNNWRWLPAQQNIADEATRLRHNKEISSNCRWFIGPKFLRDNPNLWPKCPDGSKQNFDDESEIIGEFTLLAVQIKLYDVKRFSSYLKLIRTIAWVLRFIDIKCYKKHFGERTLSADELSRAENIVIRLTQSQSFSDDIRQIEIGKSLPRKSPIFGLMPYKDSNNILRVNSRLNAASWLPYDTRHAIILPPDHEVTFLIVRKFHHKMAHQNHEATISEIRQRFWIPRIRQVLKKVVNLCMLCKVNKAKPAQPLMGQLPVDRLTPYVRPFSNTGLDYFGPVFITNGRRQEKRWIALFTCLNIRAVHLEVAFDLSTDACILAIRNFINRRGIPIRIRSDNGKNFVGLEGDTKQFSEVFDCDRINDELSARNIKWIFNCPLNPSEGGVWERMVQSVKRVLRQTMHNIAPREHTLQSFLIEAENIVNSRPLTYIPLSSAEDNPLTPNHFLLGTANTAQTPSVDSIDSQQKVLRKQWRISRQLRDHFWKRWIGEYLPTLTRREKWCEPSRALQVGDLVLICDVNVPRKDWLKGIVERVIPGKDGIIRRAEIRTTGGILTRPATKLAVLDIVGESG